MAKNNHGGVRKNAGRKPSFNKKEKVNVSLSHEAKVGLQFLATQNDSSLSGEITRLGELIHMEMSVDRFFSRMPLFERSRMILELISENPEMVHSEEFQNRLRDILEDFEDMVIETAYEDATKELSS